MLGNDERNKASSKSKKTSPGRCFDTQDRAAGICGFDPVLLWQDRGDHGDYGDCLETNGGLIVIV